MYSKKETVFPPRETSVVELRVTAAGGRHRTFTPADFLPMGYTAVVRTVIDSAFGDVAPAVQFDYRAYLVGRIQRAMPNDPVETVEAWRLEWIVDPLAVPPFDKAHPARQVRLGGFPASDYLKQTKAES